MINKLNDFVKSEISPLLQQHHGDMQITSLKDGVLKFKLMGQCSNCPSSRYTIEEIIETKIKEEFPEIKQIVLEHNVSEELLDIAKTILNKKKKCEINPLNILIKYCGGCNPRYDRKSFLNQITENNPHVNFTYLSESINPDLIIVFCGCTSACVSIPKIDSNPEIIIVTNMSDFDVIQSRINKIKKMKEGEK